MKEKIAGILVLILLAGLFLSSCKTETPVNETPVNEVEGEKENQSADEDGKTDESDKTEGTGENGASGETGETGEPAASEVTLYLPNETADGFLTSSMILTDTPEAIVAQLVADGALPEGVRVLNFDAKEKCLDLSKEFAEGMKQAGTTGEFLYLGSVVNTFLEHYDLDSIMLYSDGAVIETGHNTYDSPVEFVEYE